jgi:hypothetical protein
MLHRQMIGESKHAQPTALEDAGAFCVRLSDLVSVMNAAINLQRKAM